jgi:hypothetical protein
MSRSQREVTPAKEYNPSWVVRLNGCNGTSYLSSLDASSTSASIVSPKDDVSQTIWNSLEIQQLISLRLKINTDATPAKLRPAVSLALHCALKCNSLNRE